MTRESLIDDWAYAFGVSRAVARRQVEASQAAGASMADLAEYVADWIAERERFPVDTESARYEDAHPFL